MRTIILAVLALCLYNTQLNAQECEPVNDVPQLNEIMVDTPTPEDGDSGNPTTGELIEILGVPGTDIGCYSLTDGDWTVTFTPGTIIPEDGLLVVGFAAVNGGNGDLVDFDLGTCDCTFANTPNQPFILTNGGEYVAFFDADGNFLEGIILGTPSENNTPPNGASSEGGAISLTSECANEIVVIPSAESFAVLAEEPDETYTYIKDAMGNWTTQGLNENNILGVGSIGDCNESSTVATTSMLTLKVYLEGPYNGNGLMNTELGSLLPIVQPYADTPYGYEGDETLTIPTSNIVDWVLVELRTGIPNLAEMGTSIVSMQAAILTTDGQVLDGDGNNLIFSNIEIGEEYYLCIRHRNHLDVLSGVPFIAAPTVSYDFTTAIGQAFGPEQIKEVEPGIFALHAGDFTADGVIQVTDYDVWFALPAILNTYAATDANLDGTVQNTDYDQWFFNKAKIGTVEINY